MSVKIKPVEFRNKEVKNEKEASFKVFINDFYIGDCDIHDGQYFAFSPFLGLFGKQAENLEAAKRLFSEATLNFVSKIIQL